MTFLNTLAVAALVVTVWVVAGQVITVQFVAAWDVSALVTISEDDFIVVCEVDLIYWYNCLIIFRILKKLILIEIGNQNKGKENLLDQIWFDFLFYFGCCSSWCNSLSCC